jgi:steroid delta-isomerase-like uncharacterized protein
VSAEDCAAKSRRLLEVGWNGGDVAVFDEILAPEVVNHDPAGPGDVSGIEGQKEKAPTYRTAMSDMKLTIDDVVANDNTCVVRWTARGTNDGELMGAPPTGSKVEVTGISIDRFNADGKLVEIWDQWDNFGFMGQLGLVPKATAAS